MRDECLALLESKLNHAPQCNVRHISMRGIPTDINEAMECFPVTRSLISSMEEDAVCFVQNIGFVKSNFLRVLELPVCPIEKTMVTPEKMKHLRYLNLSHLHTSTTIPEAITTLYLLQTLRLFCCPRLSKLPEGMRYMISLRHLYIEKCFGLKCVPPGLGELELLRTLTYYIVTTGVRYRIGEIKTLYLGGQLELYNLRDVRDARDAKEVNMTSKQNLDRLALCWGMPGKDFYNDSEAVSSSSLDNMVVDPFEVLDALKPCDKLKVLRIEEYGGDKFPAWMTEYQMLENLVELYIIECRRCTNVSPLHKLPLLQILHIKFMDNLRHLCCGVFTNVEDTKDALVTFPSLKSLILYEMPNLNCWCEGDIGNQTSLNFPVLSELLITNCPKLSAIPVASLLEGMSVKGNKTLSCFAAGLTTLRKLTLESSNGTENNADEPLTFKPWESLESLGITGFNNIIPPIDWREGEEPSTDANATALQNLHIISSNYWFSPIPSNSSLWLWKCFRFLKLLYIENCNNLISWPEEEFSNLNYLTGMEIHRCRNFLGSLSELPPEMSTR